MDFKVGIKMEYNYVEQRMQFCNSLNYMIWDLIK